MDVSKGVGIKWMALCHFYLRRLGGKRGGVLAGIVFFFQVVKRRVKYEHSSDRWFAK